MNEEDSRNVVNEFAAAIRSEEPTFSVTHTLNQSRMFGVASLHDVNERNTANIALQDEEILKRGYASICDYGSKRLHSS